jgi:hypothetical protein
MTDSKGDSHAKVFSLSVDLAGPTVTVTPTLPPATPTPPPNGCSGDCNDDGEVTVDELIKGVNIALGTLGIEACPSFDVNGDGEVTVNEIVRAVNAALSGCLL